jgi:hypothetical protein
VEAYTRWTTAAEADEGAENLPARRRVERMIDTNNIESRLWKLLEKEHLTDLSQFHQPGFFDEVPLYSRQSDVDFLPDDKNEANEILLRFALKFLKSVVAYEQHRTGYFAAITVWNFSDALLVPNLFVWCDALRGLKEKLTLQAVATSFGKEMKRLTPKLDRRQLFDVLEDASTLPETTRVFIALAQPPYSGLATLDSFRKLARTAK